MKGLVTLFFLAYTMSASGQLEFLSLTGKITDAETHLPIPFVSVQLSSTSTGTVTNTKGEFIFKIPESHSRDTLSISCVGYKPLTMALASIGLNISLELEPAIVQLAEVTVTAQSGLDMLKTALSRIPENYDTADVELTAFYREDLKLGDFELAFNEAVLDIRKTFKTDKELNDKIRIIKGRKKPINFAGDGRFYYWMSGISNGARGSLGEDFIKYNKHEVSPWNPRNFRYYNYDYRETIHEGQRDLAVIDITPKKQSRKGILHMKLYVDEASYAIVKYDLEATEAGIRRVERKDKGLGYAIMSKLEGLATNYHKFQSSVTFKKYNGKFYLHTVTRHWEILVNSKKRNMVDRLWHADMDFIVTDIDTDNIRPITQEDIGDERASMTSLIGNDYDAAFWENYNILKPVIPDSLKSPHAVELTPDSARIPTAHVSNRQNGFTRADTLRGALSPLRTCYDVTFYHLDVAIDMDKRSVKGNNVIRFKAEEPFRKMQVDLYENMRIDKILFEGDPLPFTREYNAVFISFPEMLKKDAEKEIKIYYEGVPKTPDWSIPMDGGVLWDKDSLGNTWAQMVCQGDGASVWWPNKDHQSDEPDSMKIWITIPSQFTEVSNGRLRRKTPLPGDQMRYEWYVSYPINNYNVTFSIGKYTHFSDLYISDDTLTIDYYVMPYNLDRAKKMFRQVRPMLETFETSFGKYPFKRDGFTLVESLYPMEHQSGVCIGKITKDNATDNNFTLWHEAAHEWWGNAITCQDVADMWIHEAFATYAETLVLERLFGKEAGNLYMRDQADAVQNKEPVIGAYDVNDIHYDIGDMYSKGSLMLHTFKNVLNNDTAWFELLRSIQANFRYRTITSDQLVDYINRETGTDYTYLFDQYLKFTTIPELQLQLEPTGTDLRVKYRWKSNVDNFRMPIKVTVARDTFGFIYPSPEWKTVTLRNMPADDFSVDEEEFYVDVSEVTSNITE